jgi:hypothetical protein
MMPRQIQQFRFAAPANDRATPALSRRPIIAVIDRKKCTSSADSAPTKFHFEAINS